MLPKCLRQPKELSRGERLSLKHALALQGSFNHMNRGALSCDSSLVRFMWFQPMASSYDCSVARFMWLQPMTSSYDSSLVRFIWFQPLASSYDCSVVRFMWLQLSRQFIWLKNRRRLMIPAWRASCDCSQWRRHMIPAWRASCDCSFGAGDWTKKGVKNHIGHMIYAAYDLCLPVS